MTVRSLEFNYPPRYKSYSEKTNYLLFLIVHNPETSEQKISSNDFIFFAEFYFE